MFLVLGGTGNLGSSICRMLQKDNVRYFSTNSSNLDVSNELTIRSFIRNNSVKKVINCIAYTDVDGCEKDPQKAASVNSMSALNIAKACRSEGVKLIHISTDYVFDGSGDKPYSEKHPTGAIQIYGKTKAEAETHVLSNGGVVARVQWILGYEKPNFVTWVIDSLKTKKQINLSTVQYGSPTSCNFISDKLLLLANSQFSEGIYHIVNDNYVSRYECGMFISRHLRISPENILIETNNVNFGLAKRPVNTRLSNSRFKNQFGIRTPWAWQQDLAIYLKDRYGLAVI